MNKLDKFLPFNKNLKDLESSTTVVSPGSSSFSPGPLLCLLLFLLLLLFYLSSLYSSFSFPSLLLILFLLIFFQKLLKYSEVGLSTFQCFRNLCCADWSVNRFSDITISLRVGLLPRSSQVTIMESSLSLLVLCLLWSSLLSLLLLSVSEMEK